MWSPQGTTPDHQGAKEKVKRMKGAKKIEKEQLKLLKRSERQKQKGAGSMG